MLSVCLYFHVHQPYRVGPYRIFDIGNKHDYFNYRGEGNLNNEWVLKKVAGKCYRPAGELFLELLGKHPELKLSFSFSGVALEQMEAWAPDVLEIYKKMIKTKRVEIVGETYYHSLAYFYSLPEFERQIEEHARLIKRIFGVAPTKTLRNTELSYTNSLAAWAANKKYKAVLMEGWEPILEWRAPTYVYKPPQGNIALLLKHYKLSDDIAFRFHDPSWAGWPLTADKFAHWVHAYHGNGTLVNLFLDYETFGEHKWAETGIFEFVRYLPGALLSHPDTDFVTTSEAASRYKPAGVVDVPHVISWADTDRDLSAWMGNDLQKSALHDTYALEEKVIATGDDAIIGDWRKLQTSDHFYYMCTKWWNDGDIHAYFNPYESPYNAYIAFRNALTDLSLRVAEAPKRGSIIVRKETAIQKNVPTPKSLMVRKVAKKPVVVKVRAVKRKNITKKKV